MSSGLRIPAHLTAHAQTDTWSSPLTTGDFVLSAACAHGWRQFLTGATAVFLFPLTFAHADDLQNRQSEAQDFEWMIVQAAPACSLDIASGLLIMDYSALPDSLLGYADRPVRDATRLSVDAFATKLFPESTQAEGPPNAVLTGALRGDGGTVSPNEMASVVMTLTTVTASAGKAAYEIEQSAAQSRASLVPAPAVSADTDSGVRLELAACALMIDPQNGAGMSAGCCGL